MKIHFWGVRGSIATPGPETVRYGGNTPCVSLGLDEANTLVLDAGTGLYRFSREAPSGAHTYFILLSHLHWDHIQGFPMFRQHMNPDVTIRVLCDANPEWARIFLSQLDGIRFPVRTDELAADVGGNDRDSNNLLAPFGVTISWIRLNHRGECYGYRIETPDGALLYVTDNEMDAVSDVYLTFEELSEFCHGASILIHDAAFMDSEMPANSGMGHSTVERACELAAASNARRLVLFHHDPGRSDDMLDDFQRLAREQLAALGARADCMVAREGLELEI